MVGFAEDGPEWLTAKNMFSITGKTDPSKVATTYGQFAKAQGATSIGAIGYAISPLSAEGAKAAGASGEAAGLKAGFIDAKFPFGSTDVQPTALAMKQAGVDAVFPQVSPNTAFALLAALKNEGVNPKVAFFAIGYGGDLLDSGAAALKTADGSFFGLAFEPIEMDTPATQAFLAALKATGGTQTPGTAVYTGYASILLLVEGLKNASGDITDKQVILEGLSKVHAFDAGGLTGKPFDPADPKNIVGPNNCVYMAQFTAGKFTTVPNADPVCGSPIAGKTVSP